MLKNIFIIGGSGAIIILRLFCVWCGIEQISDNIDIFENKALQDGEKEL